MVKIPRAELTRRLAERIARMEGFYNKLPSRALRNNNPGNLRMWGLYPVIEGYVKFPNVSTGWKALYTQVNRNVFQRGLTFLEFFAGKPGVYFGFAPTDDGNHPKKYAQFVAGEFNVPIDTVIRDLAAD